MCDQTVLSITELSSEEQSKRGLCIEHRWKRSRFPPEDEPFVSIEPVLSALEAVHVSLKNRPRDSFLFSRGSIVRRWSLQSLRVCEWSLSSSLLNFSYLYTFSFPPCSLRLLSSNEQSFDQITVHFNEQHTRQSIEHGRTSSFAAPCPRERSLHRTYLKRRRSSRRYRTNWMAIRVRLVDAH